MPLVITDVATNVNAAGTSVPLQNATVTASPSKKPLFQSISGQMRELTDPTRSATTDVAGNWSISLPWPSESLLPDGSTPQWGIRTPDGFVFNGTVPEGIPGPVTLYTLINTYGWAVGLGTLTTPVAIVKGNKGDPGAGGSLPSQTGQAGKFLTTDGAALSWGTPAGGSSLPVLDFPSGRTTHSDHGIFWPSGSLGTGFWWDGWAMARNTGYIISEGRGGAHALLIGLSGSPTTGMTLTGNVWDGSTSHSFQSVMETGYVNAGEWFHWAVGWDGSTVRLFLNGVLVNAMAFAGPRSIGLDGDLYVGGSDHIMLDGRIAWIRGWEGKYVVGAGVGNQAALDLAFIPDRFPRAYAWSHVDGTPVYCDFLGDYMCPGAAVPDRSKGFNGTPHPGFLYNVVDTNSSALQIYNLTDPMPALPVPSWVTDPQCPVRLTSPLPLQNELALTPPSTPAGALVFDSFSRRNQTYASHLAPTLGVTEAGSLGPLAWNVKSMGTVYQRQQPFGILSGKAVFLWTEPTGAENAIAWVADVGTADMQVSVDRYTANNLPIVQNKTGVVFRVQDASNYWYVMVDDNYVNIGNYIAGAHTIVNQTLRPGIGPGSDNWTTLMVIAKGTTITTYIDGVQLSQVTGQTALQTARGAGLGSNVQYSGSNTSGYRADNFTVKAAP